MDIKALRYFVELVDQQSFTRASEKLFVTQPTISKMIRNLEQSIGQALIHREGRQFDLTDSGKVVYTRAQQILEIMGQLETELSDLHHLESGELKLGIPPMVGHLYAGLIRRYKQLYPNIELIIAEYGGRRIEQALLDGELDVAVTMLRTEFNPALSHFPLDSYPIYGILSDSEPWQSKSSVTLIEVKEEPFYLYTKEFTLSDVILTRCREENFEPQISARSSQWDFLVALVRSGVGVAFLPQPLCDRVYGKGVVAKPIEPAIDWTLGVVWNKERYLSKTAEAWINLCSESQADKSYL